MSTDRATLLTLPDELILHIVSFLGPRPHPRPGPFTYWSHLVNEQTLPAPAQLRDVQSFALCNRRLGNVTASATIRASVIEGHDSRPLCLTRLNFDRVAKSRLATIFVDCENAYNIYELFRLPNVHTLTLKHFDASLHPSPHYHQLSGQSNVKILKLNECIGLGRTLNDLLGMPAALQEFWYSSNVANWNENKNCFSRPQSVLQDGTPWSHFIFETAIAKQRVSLQKLVVSRHGTGERPIVHGNLFDLRQFKNLRSLCIDHCDMLDEVPAEDVWHRLPPNLEELELAYGDDALDVKTYSTQDDPQWLFQLLEPTQKDRYAPLLSRLRLHSLVWPAASENRSIEDRGTVGTDSIAHVKLSWEPPSKWIQRCDDAHVSLRTFAQTTQRCEYLKHGDGRFAAEWEETWLP